MRSEATAGIVHATRDAIDRKIEQCFEEVCQSPMRQPICPGRDWIAGLQGQRRLETCSIKKERRPAPS